VWLPSSSSRSGEHPGVRKLDSAGSCPTAVVLMVGAQSDGQGPGDDLDADRRARTWHRPRGSGAPRRHPDHGLQSLHVHLARHGDVGRFYGPRERIDHDKVCRIGAIRPRCTAPTVRCRARSARCRLPRSLKSPICGWMDCRKGPIRYSTRRRPISRRLTPSHRIRREGGDGRRGCGRPARGDRQRRPRRARSDRRRANETLITPRRVLAAIKRRARAGAKG
jgi:hypothetical protein